jgi:hypothetical protein
MTPTKELKHRKKQFKIFRKILTSRHGQNHLAYQRRGQPLANDAAQHLGRYLRAARANAGLSLEAAALQSKISPATLIALEQGLVLGADIEPKWLVRLARTLGENEQNFNILLGRNRSPASQSQPWLSLAEYLRLPEIHSTFSLLARPMYATVSALLLCVIVSATLFLGPAAPHQSPPHKPAAGVHFVDVEPTDRPNLIKAEYRLESQVLIPAKEPEEPVEPQEIKYPKLRFIPDFRFSRRFGGI